MAQMPKELQNGKPLHQPIINRPGRTKITEDRVPAAEATVWTMLFSQIVCPLKERRTAMEMTAAGMEVEKVRATLRPA